MKKIVTILVSVLSFTCIAYYTTEAYSIRLLIFDTNTIMGWSVMVMLISVSLVLGIYNSIKVTRLEKQNDELLETLKILQSSSEQHYDSICYHIQNSRELSLDIYDKLGEK